MGTGQGSRQNARTSHKTRPLAGLSACESRDGVLVCCWEAVAICEPDTLTYMYCRPASLRACQPDKPSKAALRQKEEADSAK